MRRLRRVLLVILVLIGCGIAYRVLGVYEFRSGECRAGKPQHFASTYPHRLTVMTFNIEGHASLLESNHIEEIAQTIRKYHPDVVGINEVHRRTWQARFEDQVEELRRRTGMNGVFGRSYRFMGGDFGNAILTKGDVVASDVWKLPGTGEPRSILGAIVRVNGGTIEMFVTHTTAWASINAATRKVQLDCINAHVQSSAFPFILTGDLNAPPDAPEVATFLNQNTLQFAGNPKTPTHKVMEKRLDYILVDPGWSVRSARVLDEGVSDHRPVIAVLEHQ